jgi:hypothetical protein
MKKVSQLMALFIGALLPIAASQAVPIRVMDGMVGEWHLTPIDLFFQRGVAPDTSGFGRHGRIYGGYSASYGWMDNAVNLVGDKYVQVPNSTNLNFGTGSFTLAAWVRVTNGGSFVKTIIDNRGSNGRGYSFALYGGNQLLLQLADESGWLNYTSDGTVPLTPNQWHHVAVSVNRTSWPVNIGFYIDGYRTGFATPKMGNIDNTDLPFYIGGHKDTPYYRFNDRIDEVFAYNRALPNWEIWSVLNPGKPNFTPSFWNDGGNRQDNNNCYNYANNKATNSYAQPGRAAGAQAGAMSCAAVHAASIADGLVPISDYPSWPLEFRGGLALVAAPGYDYHWYRLDDNGTWSHKIGWAPATNLDNAGNIITDPRTANRGVYTDFCGFFVAWTDIAEGYGHENIN